MEEDSRSNTGRVGQKSDESPATSMLGPLSSTKRGKAKMPQPRKPDRRLV